MQDPAEPEQAPVADLPPGLDPDELAAVPTSSARRGRLRKRVAFLRAARELLMRDLGGFVYELHRTAGDIEHEAHRRLRATKLDRLARIDAELHELELRLDDVRRNVVVREPGVGGECPECGELFGSDAHYCSHCGLPLTESARRAIARAAADPPAAIAEPAPIAAPATDDQPTQELPPLEAEGTEFDWPRREPTKSAEAGEGVAETETAAGEADAAARGEAAPAGDGGTRAGNGATAAGDGDPETRGETGIAAGERDVGARDGGEAAAGGAAETRGETTTTGDAETRGDAAAGGDTTTAGDGDAETRGDTGAGGDTTTAGDRGAETPGDGDAEARGDAAAGGDTTTSGDSGAETPGDGDAETRGAAGGGDAETRGGGRGEDRPNGRSPASGTLFSRVERET